MGARVLYVDDSDTQLRLAERLLSRRPELEVRCARTGEEALEQALGWRPQLVFLDLHLPDLPGNEVLVRLRQHPETREAVVVMVSGGIHGDADTGEGGWDAYLAKPFNAQQFLEMVDQYTATG